MAVLTQPLLPYAATESVTLTCLELNHGLAQLAVVDAGALRLLAEIRRLKGAYSTICWPSSVGLLRGRHRLTIAPRATPGKPKDLSHHAT